MTVVTARFSEDQAIMARDEFDRLVAMARRVQDIEVRTIEDDPATLGVERLAAEGGALDFLADDGDLYSVEDLRVRYR